MAYSKPSQPLPQPYCTSGIYFISNLDKLVHITSPPTPAPAPAPPSEPLNLESEPSSLNRSGRRPLRE